MTWTANGRAREALFVWHAATQEWQLDTGKGLKTEKPKEERQGYARTRNRHVLDQNNQVVKRTLRREENVPGQYRKIEEVSRDYYVVSPGEKWEIQCPTPGAAWNAPDNLVTKTRKYLDGPFAKELRSVIHPDGTVDLYEYEISSDNQRRTDTVWHGQPNVDLTGIVKGTQTVTVVGIAGENLSRQVIDLESGLVIEQEVHSQFDPLRRAQRVDYLDGTRETYAYNCCGLESKVDRNGDVTSFAYDDLNRPYATIRKAVRVTHKR